MRRFMGKVDNVVDIFNCTLFRFLGLSYGFYFIFYCKKLACVSVHVAKRDRQLDVKRYAALGQKSPAAWRMASHW
jgi:hypothetical protein